VIFGWVAKDTSVARAAAVSIHLVNTFLLLSFITLTAWWASAKTFRGMIQLNPSSVRIVFGLLGVVVLGVTGSITALGDTLFPAETLSNGLQQDFNPASHFLIRLRVWHPVLAILLGLYILGITGFISFSQTNLTLKRAARFAFALFLLQWAVGFINFLLMAPIITQLLHLLLADLVWIIMVILLATASERRAPFIVSEQTTE
jgi:heme A synthase